MGASRPGVTANRVSPMLLYQSIRRISGFRVRPHLRLTVACSRLRSDRAERWGRGAQRGALANGDQCAIWHMWLQADVVASGVVDVDDFVSDDSFRLPPASAARLPGQGSMQDLLGRVWTCQDLSGLAERGSCGQQLDFLCLVRLVFAAR